MKRINYRSIVCTAMAMGTLSFVSCSSDDDVVTANDVLGIPSDNEATPAPEIGNANVTLPNFSVTVEEESGYPYLAINMTGVWDEEHSDWLKLYGTGNSAKQNVWVTIDNSAKGIDVYNNADGDSRTLLADVVFLVDNSGSMSEEADAVANSIISWSKVLEASGLDLRVGSVGYGDSNHAIDGALNMTTPEKLGEYMNADNRYGTDRTRHYGGADAETLRAKAENSRLYENGSYNECGMVALHFANDNFAFRGGSNRIFVNFTDEPNQPNGIEKWSVEYLNPKNNNWTTNNGTVHTVYSDRKEWCDNTYLYNEQPWLMSEYTGGSIMYADRYFTNITLENLPVTGAMQNSYVIRCTNLASVCDGLEHEIKVTVLSKDGLVRGEKVIKFVFSNSKE